MIFRCDIVQVDIGAGEMTDIDTITAAVLEGQPIDCDMMGTGQSDGMSPLAGLVARGYPKSQIVMGYYQEKFKKNRFPI